MEKCSFFNAELQGDVYDRTYLAEDYAEYFASFVGNGIFANSSSNLQVIANNNMTVTLKVGKAWIGGYFYHNTDDFTLNINAADEVLNRIDRIVLRLDFVNREIKAYVKKGVFASLPVAPTITRDADMYELALADITINKGIISITQANITDLRINKELCGMVKGTIEEVDTTNLFAQYQDSFNAWFDNVKNQLSGDVAGNLQNQINNNDLQLSKIETELPKKANKDGVLQENLNADMLDGKHASVFQLKSELVGTIIIYPKQTPPTGFLKCDGALISRTTYSELFAIIGTSFGIGDGVNNFAVPDLRGQFVRGHDAWKGLDSGRVFGSTQLDEFKSHKHGAGWAFSSGEYPRGESGNYSGSASWYTNETGGTETRPKNIVLNYCIKY